MTDTTYRLAWLAYIFASTGVTWIFWRLFRDHVRCRSWQLALPILAFLLTPYFSDPIQSRLAPAALTVLFEALFGNPEIAMKAIIPLAFGIVITLMIAFFLPKTQHKSSLSLLAVVFFVVVVSNSHADSVVTSGTIQCSAQWNELCEDKKIISVPDQHQLCSYELTAAEKSGETFYQVITSDSKSITVYFKAKGNQNRIKPQDAVLKLDVVLMGVRDTEACNASAVTATPPPEPPTVSEPEPTPPTQIPPTPQTPETVVKKPHACACSQWMNWTKLERCLEVGKLRDGIPCDAYNAAIECVSSQDECRTIHRESCPQVVGLNQSTSMKRLYVENSPVCQPP